jgi:hypothetical protein
VDDGDGLVAVGLVSACDVDSVGFGELLAPVDALEAEAAACEATLP